jgi:TfoX/Sxy family transcriptional regulator of competence genes
MAYDEKTAERVRAALSGRRGVVEKKMMGGLCFIAGGGMCCSVSGRGGLLVRVSAETYQRMLREPHAAPADMRGRVMTGFVRVAPEGYGSDAALKKWVERGLEGVAARGAKSSQVRKQRTAPKPRRAGSLRKRPT